MARWNLPPSIDDAGHKRWVLSNFPQLKGLIYLNSAGFAPMPRVTITKMKQIFTRNYEQMYKGYDGEKYLAEFVKSTAPLINVRRDEMAFVTSTTAGISLFANSVKWRRGDNVVIADVEYPSNILPWVKVARANGVDVRVVRSIDGMVPMDSIEKAVDERTKVLPLSLVEFSTGQRFDIKRLGEICQKNGTLLFLDAIQALGAIEVDLRKANVAGLSAGGYKWLCGPLGSGLLYVSSRHVAELNPTSGHFRSIAKKQQKALWDKVITGGSLAVDSVSARKDASAFEFASEEIVQMAGLSESLRFLCSLGTAKIEERIARLNDYLITQLEDCGFETLTPKPRNDRAGIISFRGKRTVRNMKEAATITKRLGKITLAVRGGSFRCSAHFFNTKSDIETAIMTLSSICRKMELV